MARPAPYAKGLPRSVSREDALLRLWRISRELEALTAKRSEFWQAPIRSTDTAREIARLSKRIDRLWVHYRWLRCAIRHGSHDRIRIRARREEELERELRRRGAEA